MERVISNLEGRRKLMFYIVLGIAVIGISIDAIFEIEPVTSLESQTRLYMVYGLISYKLIELVALYFFFYHRHMVRYHAEEHDEGLLAKFDKNAKRFFALVPHGSVIFGIIAYKLTANLQFFLLFLTIAFTTLFLVKPKKFFDFKLKE